MVAARADRCRRLDARGSRDRDQALAEPGEPGQDDFMRRCVMRHRDRAEQRIGRDRAPPARAAKRPVGHQPDAVQDAVAGHPAQDVCVLPGIQLDLHRGDLRDLARFLQLTQVDVAQTDRLDPAVALERVEGAHARGERHAWIGGVELIQRDPIDAECAATGLTGGRQMLRAAVRHPPAVRPGEAALRGDDHPRSVTGPGRPARARSSRSLCPTSLSFEQ